MSLGSLEVACCCGGSGYMGPVPMGLLVGLRWCLGRLWVLIEVLFVDSWGRQMEMLEVES